MEKDIIVEIEKDSLGLDFSLVKKAIDKYKTGTTIMVPTHFVRLLALPQEIKDS